GVGLGLAVLIAPVIMVGSALSIYFGFGFKRYHLEWLRSLVSRRREVVPVRVKKSLPVMPKKTVPVSKIVRPASDRVQNKNYRLPALSLLNESPREVSHNNDEANRKMGRMLEETLAEFGLETRVAAIRPGPVITLFEIEVGKGIKTSRITSLSEDIARNMSAYSTRVAHIQGTNRIGIELPNIKRGMVFLRDQLASTAFKETDYALPISLGSDTSGKPVFVDLAKMPHLLIAGTTGSGKSVGVNGMILSLLYHYTPDEVKMIMIDPKMLEFAMYNDIPHLLIPVVVEPVKAVAALKWAVREMEERNKNMSATGTKNIESYNAKARANPGMKITRQVQKSFDPATGEPIFEKAEIEVKPIPYIVVIVDEMADLMLVAGKEVEAAIARLAAMARAAGIHLILSTQRPSVDVITGTIKSNFPNRIAYRVASKIDSRTIINEQGAELMLGKGDMLYMAMGGSLERIHGAYVSEEEIERVVAHVKSQGRPQYVSAITAEKVEDVSKMSLLDKTVFKQSKGDAEDELYARAVQIILASDRPSISFLQRQLGVGYNKSSILIEKMQANGLLSAPDSTGKRVVLKK
ncbi:MAG: FtsK/SpoIIIE domain-containing protein, partial [Alphaproteobacteria bacterium]|nr:FtsK/SpoIIIE domain-containing protein [Alphaproteobacteria bacterium]